MRHWRARSGGRIGFVPTMGYLHDGHLSLVRASRCQTDTTVASIFVNPLQFGPREDFSRYPRDPDRDLALLDAEGVACVFMPEPLEIYPADFATSIDVGLLGGRLEGAFRPGHFRGVATVVCKLFNIVRPEVAFFGRKDAQQLLVIKRMVSDLDLPIEVAGMPTVREEAGLALSSRNAYLSDDEHRQALVLSESLRLAEERYRAGERRAEAIRRAMRRHIRRALSATIDYVSVADAETLEELKTIDRPALVSLAVRIGATRLIDNTTLGEEQPT
ncbi:MAG: pantoate--beta-alanine ligase [Dehalococcoidia bacterium]